MNQLTTFDPNAIRQIDGLYCLNDLHHMAGGKDSDKPHRFLRLDKTQELIKALEISEGKKINRSPNMGYQQMTVLKTIQGGAMQGTYGNRKLLIAYANWIDPYIYDMVLEVFDRVAIGAVTYTAKINQLVSELNAITNCLSMAGRVLAVEGKQTKPQMLKDLNQLLEQQQPQLPLGGASHE